MATHNNEVLAKPKNNNKHEVLGYNPTFFKDTEIKPAFFKIEKDGKVSYLLGTMHFLPLDLLPAPILNITKQCKALLPENVRKSKKDKDKALIEEGFVTATAGSAWYNELSPTAITILKRGLDLFFALHEVKPVPIERVIPSSAYWMLHVARSYYGMDNELENQFAPHIHPLETTDPMVTVSTIPIAKSIADLETRLIEEYSFLLDIPHHNLEHMKALERYLDGSEFYNKEFSWQMELSFPMVVDRNNIWLPELMRLHGTLESPLLIAVGFGHLPGQTGLLCLLEREGFIISKYQYAPLNDFFPMIPSLVYGEAPENLSTEKEKEITTLLFSFGKMAEDQADLVADYIAGPRRENIRQKAGNG